MSLFCDPGAPNLYKKERGILVDWIGLGWVGLWVHYMFVNPSSFWECCNWSGFVEALQTPTVGVNLQTFCNLLSNFQLHLGSLEPKGEKYRNELGWVRFVLVDPRFVAGALQTPTVDVPTFCKFPNFQSRLGSSKPKSEKYTVFNSSVASTNLAILVCWSGYNWSPPTSNSWCEIANIL